MRERKAGMDSSSFAKTRKGKAKRLAIKSYKRPLIWQIRKSKKKKRVLTNINEVSTVTIRKGSHKGHCVKKKIQEFLKERSPAKK